MAVKGPVDLLRDIAAPRELIEWVRKLPPETAARAAWVDARKADWLPYLAAVRGLSQEAILKATCEVAIESAAALDGPEATRVLDLLRLASVNGRVALETAETDLADLKLAIISWGHNTQPTARPPWMTWVELVLELARATARRNLVIGAALAMKMLANENSKGKLAGRNVHSDLVSRFRDKLTLAG